MNTKGHKLYRTRRICRICETKPCLDSCHWINREYPMAYSGPTNHTAKELRELAEVMPIACGNCCGGKL